jgi:hypothetical protein
MPPKTETDKLLKRMRRAENSWSKARHQLEVGGAINPPSPSPGPVALRSEIESVPNLDQRIDTDLADMDASLAAARLALSATD